MENKSKKTIYFLAVLAAVLVASFGCKDEFFNQDAGDRITPDQHYNSIIDADVSIQGAFVILQDIMPNMIMLDGLRSDMMDVTPNADSYLRDINFQQISKGNPLTDASDLYKVIINVNEVLLHIDEIAKNDRNFDVLTAKAYKGALIGLRAWSYLTLTRLYNKTTYIKDNLVSIPNNLSQTVLSKEEIIPLLIEELLPYIHDTSTGVQYEELRLSHYMNTKALLGELYLEIGQFAEAAKYLKMACESYLNKPEMLKVDKSYQDAAWGAIFLNSESQNVENISVVPFSREEQQNNPLATWMGYNYEYLVKPSNIVIDSFLSQVNAIGDTIDLYRLPFTFLGQFWQSEDSIWVEDPYISKYLVDQNNPTSSDIIISRAADIHLLLAEAYNRMGDEVSQEYALMLLNQGVNKENPKPAEFTKWASNLGIRGRAYLKSREVPERDSIPLEERTLLIEDYIIAERAMELAFEGKRWFDLVRIAERRNDPAYLADKVAAKFAGTSQYDAIRNKLMNPANWYLPFD